MGGAALLDVLDGLDRLQRGAGGVFGGLQHVHRPAHRAGGIDAGAARLVREADEVRVGEAILELRHVRTLAVGQFEDRGSFERGALLLGFCITAFGLGVDFRPGVEIDTGVRHQTGGQHDQIGIGGGVFVEDQVLEVDLAGIPAGDFAGLALGEDHALLLGAAVEVLAHARHAQVLVHDHGVDRRGSGP